MPAGAPIIYFVGGEDIDFVVTGGINSGASNCRTNWARTGFFLSNSSADPPASRAAGTFSTAVSSLWFHAQIYPNALTGVASAHILRFMDGANCRLVVRDTGTAGTWAVYKRTAAGVYTQLGANFATTLAVAVTAFDMRIVYAVAGVVTIYVAGVQVFTYSGDVTTDGATTLSSVELAGIAVSAQNVIWSEIIVADVDTRASGLWLMNASAAGNAQTWSGTPTNVNKSFINDGTYITALSAGLIEEFKTPDIAFPTGTFIVAAVKLSSRALVGTSGPQHIQYVVRTGSTPADYTGGSWTPVGPGTFYNDLQNYMLPTNPATGIAWTTADLQAAGFNYGIVSAA